MSAAASTSSLDATQDIGLHRSVLNDIRLVGQSIAGIGPTIGAVSLIPLTFADAARGAWLTVVIATVGVLAVGASISVLARHYATAGGPYNFISSGLGRWAGFVAGAVMIALFVIEGPFLAIGFGQAFAGFLAGTGIAHLSLAGVFAIEIACIAAISALAYLHIRLSTGLFLIIEGISMTIILVLLLVILSKSHSVFDQQQLRLSGTTFHGTVLGVVFFVLAFGGFEGAATLGLESKQPRRAVPLALIGAVVVVGLFFVFNAYVQVLGFEGLKLNLALQSAPLSVLANHDGVSWLGNIVLLGLSSSWFAAMISWLVYGPRVLLTMSRDGLLPPLFSRTSKKFKSPNVAVIAFFLAWAILTAYIYAAGDNATTAFGLTGAFCGYCFTLMYLLVGAATVVWAYRRGILKPGTAVAGIVSVAIMGIVFYYSFVPLPTYPLSDWLYAFGALVAAALILYTVLRQVLPNTVARIGQTQEVLTATARTAAHASTPNSTPQP
jgi:amino acid transporter